MASKKEQSSFVKYTRAELLKYIINAKKELSNELTILTHNFSIDDLLPFADVIGDASKLADAAKYSKSKYLLFTTSKFFSEAAYILNPKKYIIQATYKANCPLTYSISEEATRKAFFAIRKKCASLGIDVMPVVYFTASYQLKSFCGENNGSICTARNSKKIVSYFLNKNQSIFFTPMNNVAFNVVRKLNIPKRDICLLDEITDLDSIPKGKKIYVWNVGCYVHSGFTIEDIKKTRKLYKKISIIAHMECEPDVIAECDGAGFTTEINDMIRDGEKGTTWGIATTYNYVARMAKRHPNKNVIPIRKDIVCKDMVVTDLKHVAKSLKSIIDYKNGNSSLKNQIEIDEKNRANAECALKKMFYINDQC